MKCTIWCPKERYEVNIGSACTEISFTLIIEKYSVEDCDLMNLSHFFHRCALPVNWSNSPCLANGEHDARSVSAMFATTVSERYEITLRVSKCNVCNELSWHDCLSVH